MNNNPMNPAFGILLAMVIVIFGMILLLSILEWLDRKFITPFFNAQDYKKDIPGKYHIIETLSDGSEKAAAWFVTEDQANQLFAYWDRQTHRLMPTNYKPKNS